MKIEDYPCGSCAEYWFCDRFTNCQNNVPEIKGAFDRWVHLEGSRCTIKCRFNENGICTARDDNCFVEGFQY